MSTLALESFPPLSRVACCGTCAQWSIHRVDGRPVAVCPVVGQLPDDDLAACGCAAWVRETRESYAVALYARITEHIG